jgi:transcriptional regulator with XRE-family HTH domain
MLTSLYNNKSLGECLVLCDPSPGDLPRRVNVMATSVRVESLPAAPAAPSILSTPGVEERPVVRCERCRLVQFRASHNRCRRCLVPFVMAAPPPPEPVVEMDAHPNIAAGVRSWRQMRGLTQKQLASAAQLPRTYISRIENGRILPGLSTLERVAIALHIGLPALLDRRCRNGNGHSNGNGHHAVNDDGRSNGNGAAHGASVYQMGMNAASDSEDFLRQMVRMCRQLTEVQRANVLERVRQLAVAHN